MFSKSVIRGFTRAAGIGLMSLFTLVGCASGPKPFDIKGEADPVINRDINGKPLSIVVHLYQLKDAGEFSKLTYDMLASGRPVSELLGKDLLEKTEVMLVPGTKYTATDKVNPDAAYIGVVAFFRQPDQHYWRLLADANQVRSGGLSFRVRDCYLSLASPKPSPIPGQPANAQPLCAGADNRPANYSSNASTSTAARQTPVQQQGSKHNGIWAAAKQVLETAKQADSLLPKKP